MELLDTVERVKVVVVQAKFFNRGVDVVYSVDDTYVSKVKFDDCRLVLGFGCRTPVEQL